MKTATLILLAILALYLLLVAPVDFLVACAATAVGDLVRQVLDRDDHRDPTAQG